MANTVTIGLYSIETSQGDFARGVFQQKENVKRIVEGLKQAAANAGDEPPTFILSALLVPNWKKSDNSYTDPQYVNAHRKFIEEMKTEFESLGLEVQAFYEESNLTEDEKTFMHQLQNNGSNADIIKTKALINNVGNRHLQLDSNTIIVSYDTLYQKTFGRSDDEQLDALVANYYTDINVSANNKIVYTCENSTFAPALRDGLARFTSHHKDNKKYKSTNAIYEEVFAPKLESLGLVDHVHKASESSKFYSARLGSDVYRITPDIVTAINMSWAGNAADQSSIAAQLKRIPTLKVDEVDTPCDFASFGYLIRKYTGRIPQVRDDDAKLYERLLEISDNALDVQIIAMYYNHAIKEIGDNPELAKAMARIFPDTQKGRFLTNMLFGCPVKDLYQNPSQECRILTENQLKNLTYALGFVQHLQSHYMRISQRPEDYLAKGAFKKILKERLAKDKILPGSSQEKILNFFTLLQEGMSKEDLTRNISDILSLKPEERMTAFLVLQAILIAGSDIPTHLNYIQNRQQLLSEITIYSQQNQASAKRPFIARQLNDNSQEQIPNKRTPLESNAKVDTSTRIKKNKT